MNILWQLSGRVNFNNLFIMKVLCVEKQQLPLNSILRHTHKKEELITAASLLLMSLPDV
jgi:hypothetical protein